MTDPRKLCASSVSSRRNSDPPGRSPGAGAGVTEIELRPPPGAALRRRYESGATEAESCRTSVVKPDSGRARSFGSSGGYGSTLYRDVDVHSVLQ